MLVRGVNYAYPVPKIPDGCDPNSIVLTFPVANEHASLRVDRFIQLRIPRLSRTRAKKIVQKCAYTEDGRKLRASQRVKAGEIVLLVRAPMNEPETPRYFRVLHQDDHVIAIDKPSGLPMHPTATYHRNTLTRLLELEYGEKAVQFAHRLDRETSGIVLCGKTRAAEIAMKRLFETRQVQKTYLAIVRGEMREREGEIDAPLGEDPNGPHVRMVVRPDGLHALTRFEVLERARGYSMVRLFPKTGRQHQLRVHLAELGHPIVGDKLYGPEGAAPFLENIETGWTRDLSRRTGHPRHALHAASIEIEHPSGGRILRVDSELPWDLEVLWQQGAESLEMGPSVTAETLLRSPEVEDPTFVVAPPLLGAATLATTNEDVVLD